MIITQTGGGCRASNYIYLLRKALKKNKLEHIPVISFNLNGMENPGFMIRPSLLVQFVYATLYGDILMLLQIKFVLMKLIPVKRTESSINGL